MLECDNAQRQCYQTYGHRNGEGSDELLFIVANSRPLCCEASLWGVVMKLCDVVKNCEVALLGRRSCWHWDPRGGLPVNYLSQVNTTLTHKYKRTYYLPNILVKTTLTHRRTFYFNLLHIDVFSFRSVFILTSVQALLQWKPQTFSEGTQNYVAGERNTLQVTFSVWRWPSMFLEYLV